MAKGGVVIGLVGQVCAGKSAVAAAFRRHGARVWDADQAVHAIYRRPEVIGEVRTSFGDGVIDESGQVDRATLGRLVFADPEKLWMLTEQVIYPRTGEEICAEIERFRASGEKALVLDAPTLLESGRGNVCDRVVFVTAPAERREAWARARGWPDGELARRDGRLMNETEKRRRASAVIENNGTLDDLDARVAGLLNDWCGSPPRD